MDIIDQDLLNLWTSLNRNGVEYIMVGGVAVTLHGYIRLTADIDVWINDTVENRRKLRVALREYGMGDFFMMETLQIVPGWTYFHLNNGIRMDLMVNVKGLEGVGFDECLKYAFVAEVHGVNVPFLHFEHLLSAKKAANRPKDQPDIAFLEQLKQLHDQEK